MRWLGQLSPEVVLVRAGAAAAGLGALLLALPAPAVSGVGLVAASVLALLAAAAPRGPWTTVIVLVAVAGWLIATAAYGQPVTAARVVLLGSALYLLHSLTVLAAALPLDAAVSPEVPLRWLLRTLLVCAVAGVFTAAVLRAGALVEAGTHQVATVAGLLAAAAIVVTLTIPRNSG